MRILLIIPLAFSLIEGLLTDISEDDEVIPQSAIDYINSVQDSWVASKDWVGSMTIRAARGYAKTIISPSRFPEYQWGSLLNHLEAPSSFDSRTQWPKCIHPIFDQGKCNSGWAFAASQALSDRLCINSNGTINATLSPQYLVDCLQDSNGCSGGSPYLAWGFMMQTGLPTLTCAPYFGIDLKCPNTCVDRAPLVTYKATSVNTYSGAASIKAAILAGGPIETSFIVYQDFMSYSSGVYVHSWGAELGYQSVKILGWGVAGSRDYWICANSWGTGWGQQGFFWIGFGVCGIDSQAYGGSAQN